MAKFALLRIWQYFPDFELAVMQQLPDGKNYVLIHYSWLNFTISGLFILFAVFDWWFFVFHPFLMGIVIDLEEKRQ
jgi:hypothetical protein